MSERDTDIEFDFFDEPETEEATERVRTPRRPPPRGPRRPIRPPAGLIPMLRLAGLIAFLILAVVLLVVLARGCASSSKHDKYQSYITDVRGIAGRSAQIGKQLNSTLAATGIKESELEAKIKGYAAQEQQEVAQARDLNPPGPLRVEHDHLIEVLGLRASGLSRLADAFRQTATAKDATTAGRLIADQARLLVASDVFWDFYFKEPTQRELERQARFVDDAGTQQISGGLVAIEDEKQDVIRKREELAPNERLVDGRFVVRSEGRLQFGNVICAEQCVFEEAQTRRANERSQALVLKFLQ